MARDPIYDVELTCWSCKSYFTVHRVSVDALAVIRGEAVCNKCGAVGDLSSINQLHEVIRIDKRG
jgi:hypothetical protein